MTEGHTSAGIALAVLSAIFTGTGTVVEKVALQRLPELHARRSWEMVRTLFGSPRWLIGCALLIGGLGCQGLALTLVPLSVAQPIFASGIVLLLVLSHFVLHDRLGRLEWVGVTTIVLALVVLGLSIDPRVDKAGGPASLRDLALAAIPTCAFALAVFAAADRAGRPGSSSSRVRAPLFGVAAGLFYGVAGLALKSSATYVQRFGLIGAIPHLVASPSPYLLVVTCAVGLLLFQTGLQRCQASVVAPVNAVTSSAYLIGVGTVLFNEHLPTAAGLLTLRIAGFAGVVAGLVTLAISGDRGDAEDDAAVARGRQAPSRLLR
jgi:drug/metabolite transporter (DMT)-like permease